MEPSELKEIDSLYRNVISSLPLKDRISYCEQLIDKAQLSIIRNKKFISKELAEQLKTIIEAAQFEIKQVANK
ncbi:MAG: hypothetical protein ACYDCN_11390 [Bacteroidia bacterium]